MQPWRALTSHFSLKASLSAFTSDSSSSRFARTRAYSSSSSMRARSASSRAFISSFTFCRPNACQPLATDKRINAATCCREHLQAGGASLQQHTLRSRISSFSTCHSKRNHAHKTAFSRASADAPSSPRTMLRNGRYTPVKYSRKRASSTVSRCIIVKSAYSSTSCPCSTVHWSSRRTSASTVCRSTRWTWWMHTASVSRVHILAYIF